jgi:hypothetical protein
MRDDLQIEIVLASPDMAREPLAGDPNVIEGRGVSLRVAAVAEPPETPRSRANDLPPPERSGRDAGMAMDEHDLLKRISPLSGYRLAVEFE